MPKPSFVVLSLSLILPWSLALGAILEPQWDIFNDPALILAAYENNFASLPASGSVGQDHIPWSDSYWQNNRGGIAYRWNSRRGREYNFRSPDRQSAATLSYDQISTLSPAEKYDLFLGHYDYPLTARVHNLIGRSASWEGICHGWTAASLNYVEPAPVTLTNPDGIVVPFGSSDVKALLSFYYAWDANTPAHNLGLRCDSYRSGQGACGEDANAGAFHIILANQLGVKHEGFIADVDRGAEVWNQPVYAFESHVLSEMGPGRYSAPGTVRQLLVDTRMTYSNESISQWLPVTGTTAFNHETVTYRYWLEINSQGQIIGGLWDSYKRPDFIWTKGKTPEFTGDLSELTRIYKPIQEAPLN